MREEVYLKFDDETNLHVVIWKPVDIDKAIGTIQIAHGMAEHIERYNEFANFLTDNKYIVIGLDLYAHGKSVNEIAKIGIINKYDFMTAIIHSIKLVHDELNEYYKKNTILFAHSMGSMAAQRYIELYPNDFEKLILSGTDCPNIKYVFAKLITRLKHGKIKKNGKIYYSKFVHNMGVGAFNKKFTQYHPTLGWLSSNISEVEKYDKDELCGAMFPTNYYYSLSSLLLKSKKERKKINNNLKILILSGENDPVGNFGKSPTILNKEYLKLGLNCQCKLYPNGRHECLNEVLEIKSNFYKDVLDFCNQN